MLVTALIWAGNNVLVKSVLDEISPLAYVFGRFVLAVVILFAVLALQRADLRVRRADLPYLLLSGIAGFAIYNALFTVGLNHTSAFAVAVLIATGPIFTLVFAALLGIEPMGRVQGLGIAVACAGVVVFVWDKLAGNAPVTGDILSLVAAASWAVYSLATRPLVRRYPPPVVTAWSSLIGLVAVAPFAVPAVATEHWRGVHVDGWAALLYSSVLSMLVGYTIWAWAIERRGVGRTVPFMYLVPIATGVFAAIFLGESLTWRKLAGAGLVLGGIAVVRAGTKRVSQSDALVASSVADVDDSAATVVQSRVP